MYQNDNLERLKREHPAGSKLVVRHMEDPHPVKPWSIGIVDHVDDAGIIYCTFEDGRYLGVIPSIDSYSKLIYPNRDDGAR